VRKNTQRNSFGEIFVDRYVQHNFFAKKICVVRFFSDNTIFF